MIYLRISQLLLVIELVVLLVPISLLSVGLGGIMVYGAVIAVTSGTADWFASLLALAILASWAALIAVWMLGLIFLRWGRLGLVWAPRICWTGANIGLILVTGSTVLLLFDMNVFLWLGAPAIIPLAHLLIERRLGFRQLERKRAAEKPT